MPFDLDPNTCDASKADLCFCDAAATSLGAIVIATATDDGLVRVEAIHGNPGGIVVGESLALPVYLDTDARPGDSLFLSILPNPARPDMHTFNVAFRIDADQLEVACNPGAPPLPLSRAIDAALAERCDAHLGAIDDEWLQSQCDEGGCSASGGSAFATVLVVAVIKLTLKRR
ncbi:MAG: hypothetical protein H0V17_07985 [Deltaproteobacteria bacterium]|nr:hypothetical protein [Deltaproteobacteria bacterium]